MIFRRSCSLPVTILIRRDMRSNGKKTSIVCVNTPTELNQFLKDQQLWTLNLGRVTVTDRFTHLGIQCSNEQTYSMDPTVTERLSTARKTTYALMGVGWGKNGLPPTINVHIQLFILPRFIYIWPLGHQTSKERFPGTGNSIQIIH